MAEGAVLGRSPGGPGPRYRLRVRGIVQGVGFRPFVHALARTLSLAGFVRNDGDGVTIEIEGAEAPAFLPRLRAEAPPLARIESVELDRLEPSGAVGFAILTSEGGTVRTALPADAATCPACLDELFDPASRFHLYPFVTCTHCGPRYTITRTLPYDRPQTALAGFPLCPDCAADYGDLQSRRYHAEALACPRCGPRLDHEIAAILDRLDQGGIVALKGLGGYQLLCDATDQAAVLRLRRRKNRDGKPFAVMVANLASARRIADPTPAEAALLAGRARPIVLLRARPLLAEAVAPGLTRLGVMLPYTPLHHLLFQHDRGYPATREEREEPSARVLVATSANPGGEPLLIDPAEAEAGLAGIADLIVHHDRPILIRADDSVMAVQARGPVFLRRARGFVPDPIPLGGEGPPVLAVGAHLKTTVTVTRGSEAFVSQHVGSLDNAATLRFFEESIAHLLRLTGVRPELVVCDLHPDLYGRRWAESSGLPVRAVQHHLAHIAAVVAEHRPAGPVLGAALDGAGWGEDGTVWGGELLRLDGGAGRRIGHLLPLALPGGDHAAREPWRMGVAALFALDRLDQAAVRFARIPGAAALIRALPRLRPPLTSSLGRLFDAAAALLGGPMVQSYEAEAAMALEALVETPQVLAEGWRIDDGNLDLRPLLAHLAEPGMGRRQGAELLHGTLIAALAEWIADAAGRTGIATVALGGGCLANRVLADGLAAELVRRGLAPLLPSLVPAGDGGLSLGQAYLGRF